MRVGWSDAVALTSFYDDWDDMPTTPGVYIICAHRPIPRIGGVDRRGILYIGRASRVRSRLWNFWYCNHTASGFLWTHPDIARLVLGGNIRSVADVERKLGRLTARYATPIRSAQLGRAERALLFAYVRAFGEAPPLNLSLTKRWDRAPTAYELRWAERGLFEGV